MYDFIHQPDLKRQAVGLMRSPELLRTTSSRPVDHRRLQDTFGICIKQLCAVATADASQTNVIMVFASFYSLRLEAIARWTSSADPRVEASSNALQKLQKLQLKPGGNFTLSAEL